jgi:hypothetical protein
MEIIKSNSLSPRKCEYGDFELRPEAGWKISQTFIDYESKLLIVSVSNEDRSQWINTGFGRTIPTKEYKINLQTLTILTPEEWQKYFNYDKVELISADKRFKLISQRIFEPEHNNDGYEEELYDLTTNERISRSSSVAFRKEKRENLLDSHYRLQKEKDKQQQILDAKPTLEQFYLRQLEELTDQDDILYYHDELNVYQLRYAGQQFILSGGGKLPTDGKEWKSIKFALIKRYNNLDEFWEEFITYEKWYLRFKYLNAHGLKSSKVLVLAKHINSFFNELRRTHNFTYQEYNPINNWSNLVWSDEYKSTELKQWCSNCYKEVYYQVRYPKYICSECVSKNKYDRKGNLVEFYNQSISGGLRIAYVDSHGKTIREDDTQEYCECIIDDKLFFAQEAKFGGIVIQKKD